MGHPSCSVHLVSGQTRFASKFCSFTKRVEGWGGGGGLGPHTFLARGFFLIGSEKGHFQFWWPKAKRGGVKGGRSTRLTIRKSFPLLTLMPHLLFVEMVPLQVKRSPTHFNPSYLSRPHSHNEAGSKKTLSENNFFFGFP